MKIERGRIYTADLNPRQGTEPGKTRPVLVIQTDLINVQHPSTIVALLTTQVRPKAEILRVHLRKGEAGLKYDSDIMIDQLPAIDNTRFRTELGKLTPARLRELEEKVCTVLDLAD